MNLLENININNNRFVVKNIGKDNLIDIKNLFERCYDYFQMSEGRKATDNSSIEFLSDLPPNKTIDEKHLIGVFDGELLIGVLDIVENYPVLNEWIIGLMLLDPEYRKIGLGKKIHGIIIQSTKKLGANKLRIGVLEQNTEGFKFWNKIGYKEIKRTEPRKYGNKKCIVIVMNYILQS